LQLDPSKRQAADEANRVGRKRASAVIIALLDDVLSSLSNSEARFLKGVVRTRPSSVPPSFTGSLIVVDALIP
jgi:hypothetical protein